MSVSTFPGGWVEQQKVGSRSSWTLTRCFGEWRCPDDGCSQLSREGCGHVQVCGISLTCYVLGKVLPDVEVASPFPWKSWHAIQFCNFPTCCQSALLTYSPHRAWSSYYCSSISSLCSNIHGAESWSRACLDTFVYKLSLLYTWKLHAKDSDVLEKSC